MKPAMLALTYLTVFLTGAAGLIYQVVWHRYLTRLFGTECTATAVILAVFLGGLSLGYLACGRLTTRITNQFRSYALLEATIGAWALAFPFLFRLVDEATRGWSFAPPFWMVAQGTVAAAALLGVPTLCMGGTVPLLTRALSPSLHEATRVHASVYAANTAGAFAGALAAGFFLVPGLGLPRTLRWTALLNLGAALFFVLLSRRTRAPAEPEAPGAVPGAPAPAVEFPARRIPAPALYTLAFLSGAYVMTLENVLIRVTQLTFGPSSYSFSLIVAVFVLCIAAGGAWAGRKRRLTAATICRNQVAITLSLLALYGTLDVWPYGGHLLRICFQPNLAGFWFYHAAVLGALLLALALPVTLIGCTLPLLFHELKQRLSHVGAHSGTLFSWNAAGCVLGSLLGGLLLYHIANNAGVFLSAAALAAVSAVVAAWTLGAAARLAAGGLAAAALALAMVQPFYHTERFAYGTFRVPAPTPFSFAGPRKFQEEFLRDRPLRFYRDGPAGTVAVLEETGANDGTGSSTNAPALSIVINGKPDSNTRFDAATLKLAAHLPALCAARRARALVIGLGTGVTAGELTLYPDVKRIDVAEISPTVVETLPLFAASHHRLHLDPRLRIHVGDAFRVLGRSRERWDLIISEPSNPWVGGVDQLFTREFYRMVKAHLTDGGVLVQWLQAYDLNGEAYGLVLATLRSEFPHCAVFLASPGDFLLLATPQPLTNEDRKRVADALEENAAVRESLSAIGIASGPQLFSREQPALLRLADQFARFGVETQDRPRLHYLAGRSFFTGERLGQTVNAGRESPKTKYRALNP